MAKEKFDPALMLWRTHLEALRHAHNRSERQQEPMIVYRRDETFYVRSLHEGVPEGSVVHYIAHPDGSWEEREHFGRYGG